MSHIVLHTGYLTVSKEKGQQLFKRMSQVKVQQISKMKEELQAIKLEEMTELEVTKRTSQTKSQKILKLEEELQAKQKGLAFLTDQFEQQKQQGKDRESVANSQVKKCFYYRLRVMYMYMNLKKFVEKTGYGVSSPPPDTTPLSPFLSYFVTN